MHNQIELTDENIQGIVSLRMERNAIKGETRKQVLERLMPTVVLDHINKDKVSLRMERNAVKGKNM